MILFYKKHLVEFLYKLFGNDNQHEVKEVISSSKGVIQKYLIALLMEVAIVAVLNTTGLYILGINLKRQKITLKRKKMNLKQV